MIYPQATIGNGCETCDSAKIGLKPSNKKFADSILTIGDLATIRSNTLMYTGTKIGNNLQTGHNSLIRENNIIGNNVSIGTNTTIEPGNTIGNNTRIHSGCFLENTKIGNNVFIGPGVVFTDDLHPICPRYGECVGGAIIGDNTSIGANATILPGIKIGQNCLIGSGAVVTSDIPDNSVAIGNPAKVIKNIKDTKCVKGFYKTPYEWRDK